MSHPRAVLDAARESLQIWTINCDILILKLVEFSNEEKWSLLIEPNQNSTSAQLSGMQHKIIRFFQSVFTRNQGNTRLSDMNYFENNLSGS